MSTFVYQGNKQPMKCIAAVYDGWRHHQCKNSQIIGDFCKIHDPDTVAEKQVARFAKWDARQAARQAMFEAPGKRIAELEAALRAILPFVPTSTAKEGGAVAYSEHVRAADMVRAALGIK